jgi:predicted metal-dependent hydrolase
MSVAVIPGNPPIEVHLRRSARARRISLKVGRVDGRVTLSLPVRGSLDEAMAFARTKEDWIRNVLPKAQHRDLSLRFGATLPVLGEPLTLTSGAKRGVLRDGDTLVVGGDESRLPAQLQGYLKVIAQRELMEASGRYAAKVGRSFRELALRDTRSRWGSCSPDGRLMYSWRLAMAPLPVLDYVAAHEVAHLVHMDHSTRFWGLVREICPGFSAHRAWLKREGSRLQAIPFHG